MAGHKIAVGNVEVTSLSDGTLVFVPSEFFPSVAAGAWEPYLDHLIDGKLTLNMGSFLVTSGTQTVLVDTGLGPGNRGLHAATYGRLMDDITAAGASPEDIDIVAATHVHPDHVGWNLALDGGRPRATFPRARYWVPKADWTDHSQRAEPASYFQEQVLALEDLGLIEFIEGEQALTSEITALPTPGHTPGHTSFLVSSQGEHAIIIGDAAHTPVQVHETSWSPRADADSRLSSATRQALMARIEGDGAVLVSGHFPAPGFGRLVRLQGRRYWRALS